MDALTLSKIKHAASLIRGLTPGEDGYYEFIEEAASTLDEVIEAQEDTPAQILRLVTNA